MRTLRVIGIIGGATAILLSGTVVLAREQATNTPRAARNGAVATSTRQLTAETVRTQAQQRIGEIKDKVIQQKAEKLAGQFQNLNKVWTDHFSNLLNRYTAIVQKMQARADIAAKNGKDVTAANASIQSAKDAIATAQAAVTAQTTKAYAPTIPVTMTGSQATATSSNDTEIVNELRTSFQNLHSTFFTDLFALRDGSMKNARVAMQTALKALQAVPEIDAGGTTATTATTTGEATSTTNTVN
jgi:hypothetical protein